MCRLNTFYIDENRSEKFEVLKSHKHAQIHAQITHRFIENYKKATDIDANSVSHSEWGFSHGKRLTVKRQAEHEHSLRSRTHTFVWMSVGFKSPLSAIPNYVSAHPCR